MREFKRKRKIRQYLYSRLALCILLVLTLLMAKAAWSVYSKERDSRVSMSRAQMELAALEARHEQLSRSIERLKTEQGVEAEIREQFQVAKPGERMVVLVDDGKDVPEEPVAKQSIVSKFFDLFR